MRIYLAYGKVEIWKNFRTYKKACERYFEADIFERINKEKGKVVDKHQFLINVYACQRKGFEKVSFCRECKTILRELERSAYPCIEARHENGRLIRSSIIEG